MRELIAVMEQELARNSFIDDEKRFVRGASDAPKVSCTHEQERGSAGR